MHGPTRYTPRFQLPYLIELGADTSVACPVFRSGELVVPTGGTVAVYDAGGGEVLHSPVAIVGGVAELDLPAVALAGRQPAEGWRVEWALDMPDGRTHTFRNDAYLVRYRLYPSVTDADIVRRLRALDPDHQAVITTETHYQAQIDEADVELQLRLIERGQRPWLIATPSALRQTWLALVIAIILEDLALRNAAAYGDQAAEWRRRYEQAYSSATVQYDRDQDGVIDSTAERSAVRPSVVWLC